MGGGPTLLTSILSFINGKAKNSKLVPIMTGKASASPMSKPSAFFPGINPPS